MESTGVDGKHFTRPEPPFVYVSRGSLPREVTAQLMTKGYVAFEIDGAPVQSKEALMQALADGIESPDYFGSSGLEALKQPATSPSGMRANTLVGSTPKSKGR